MSDRLAPIVLFVYNRPQHTRRTVKALAENDLSNQSDLIIFSDAAKDGDAAPQVEEVREYLKTITGFKSVQVVERNENWGLAKSIVQGVTDIVNQYGKVIVLEDDIITSIAFLQFMNQALDFYEQEKKIWHISGWSYPIATEGLGDVFLWRAMNCWGWATWADRWQHFEKNPDALIENWTSEEKKRFDLDGSGVFWSQVKANAAGKINTWAIFWYATIFKKHGLCVNPAVSYVENVGLDGSGVHCGPDNGHRPTELCTSRQINFVTEYIESDNAVPRIVEFYKSLKKPFHIRLMNKLSRMLLGRNLFQ
jgi:glycosyl transferase family 2